MQDKHSCLFGPFANYDENMLYNIGPLVVRKEKYLALFFQDKSEEHLKSRKLSSLEAQGHEVLYLKQFIFFLTYKWARVFVPGKSFQLSIKQHSSFWEPIFK